MRDSMSEGVTLQEYATFDICYSQQHYSTKYNLLVFLASFVVDFYARNWKKQITIKSQSHTRPIMIKMTWKRVHSICAYAIVILITTKNQSRFVSDALSLVSPNVEVIVPNKRQTYVIPETEFKPSNESKDMPSSPIRIRSTVEDDLPTIVDLLASETISPQQQSEEIAKVKPFRSSLFSNWNVSIKKLKNEASLSSQLTHRLAAMNHATKVLSTQSLVHNDDEIDTEQMRYALWGDDTFRTKVENAVRQTSACEGTIWDDWNFAITPEKKMLHHFMLSATDDEFLDQVVGFCEVGICEAPIQVEADDCDQMEQHCIIPCIGNLVVSPNHRRRGVGKKLVKSVIRLVTMHAQQLYDNPQSHHDSMLGLFVDEDNYSAISLYEKAGFKISGKSDNNESKRIFMIHNLR